ncbi:uncharacterized protein LAJ45_06282 [Morchella importuna]|nr:uncharacterized protein LAJ45_06282 [Morchella importuna]KAH8149651.1 hypothetical protein LAJ45_06282 [Morchella importuna]
MREKLFTLKRPRMRQSWSKWNLYNLTRQRPPRLERRTFFQQKWTSKAETRAYHGEYLTARQWQTMFRRTLKAVVPMYSVDLAEHSGAHMAAGRGAGVGADQGVGVPAVPYMSQLYWPMERRLDIACYRAMFAASPRMARQFVIHGFVKVNGKKMTHPNYMLNPGDMFSVDQTKVLYATGAPKVGTGKSASESTESDSESTETPEATEEEEGTSAEASDEAPDPVTPDEALAALSLDTPSSSSSTHKKGDPNNPVDYSKPYATPWRPRDYLPPFAFIPKYLEVNHNTCHAVYLRHPVARPGQTEVPSPFGPEVMQLAFNWFLRRR